jgi:hypothetical protein
MNVFHYIYKLCCYLVVFLSKSPSVRIHTLGVPVVVKPQF